MVWPAKVKNLVVETRDVVASFRQVEDLRGREEGGEERVGGREGERERERERGGGIEKDSTLKMELTTEFNSPCSCLHVSFLASLPHPLGYSYKLTPPQSLETTWLHIRKHRHDQIWLGSVHLALHVQY